MINALSRMALALVVAANLIVTAFADDRQITTPTFIEVKSTPCGDGWKEWQIIENTRGFGVQQKRITALTASKDVLYLGTSQGRLLARHGDDWTLQCHLKGIQITGIALQGANLIWLSTSDGIRRMERKEGGPWQIKDKRIYYQGHPSFVSGGYIPGQDAVRLWGYVDGIYVPTKDTAYSPFVISTEHGLFCGSRGGSVWHHFMPHYWGANSPWLDTRTLVPHRRPTCMTEDNDGNLWIGTQWDGIIRLNSHARKYHGRQPKDNAKDGTEFTFINSEDLGCQFDKVTDLATAKGHGVWAILSSNKGPPHLARFDGKQWSTLSFDKDLCPNSVAEIKPGIALLGTGDQWKSQGFRKITWDSRKAEPLPGPELSIREIVTLANGRVFAASWFYLYEIDPTASTP